MSDCFTNETLRRWLTGALSSSEEASVGIHVIDCVHCQSSLDDESDDAVLKRWLELGRGAETTDPDPELIDRLVGELCPTAPDREPPRDPLPDLTVGGVGFADPEADIGRIGPFRLLDELGRGGMGIVYRAWDEPLRRVVALKVLRPEHAEAADRLRLVREAQLAARFQNDHAVTIHSVVDPADGLPYLVMEYVRGQTLAELIGSGQRPEPRRLATLVAQVALALDAAHTAGLVHRDVKPSNILIDSTTGRAKITDFGLARSLSAPIGITREGVVAGTPAYMSPEQARGGAELDLRTDLYSLGATLYEALTGQPPFAGAAHAILRRIVEEEPIPPRRFDYEIPADLETICLKALAKEPARRYQTARDLGDDLGRWSRGEPIHARPATRLERVWRWCSRNPGVAGLTASLAVALLAGFLGVVWQWRRAELNRQQAEANLKDAQASFARARRAVDQFYTRFYEQGVLSVPGLEKVRHDVIVEMLQYYKDFLDQHQNDPSLRRELAVTCSRLGMLTLDLGHKKDALGLVQRAFRDLEPLARDSPNDREVHDHMVRCLNNMGLLEAALGDAESARKTYQRGIELLNERLRREPGTLKLQRGLAAMNGNLANLFLATDLAQARKAYLQTLEIQKELVRRDPTQLTFKSDLAITYHNLSSKGNRDEREAWCQQSLELRKQLVDQEPTNVLYRRNLARSYQALSNVQFDSGRPKDSLKSQEECCRLLQQAVAEQPTIIGHQSDLGEAFLLLASRLRSEGREGEAKTALQLSRAIYQKLVHFDPDDTRFREELIAAEKELAASPAH
jgi:eukaryotic-like serine/threonine-protein kinase